MVDTGIILVVLVILFCKEIRKDRQNDRAKAFDV
jgi:hypothetical protein